MKLGIGDVFPHETAEEWGRKLVEIGATAASFPLKYSDSVSKIDEYVQVAKDCSIQIAEVGIWQSPFQKNQLASVFELACRQLELADYVHARCCVNISGAFGEVWDGCYAANYAEESYDQIVSFIQKLLAKIPLKNTYFVIESMPWMIPDSPEQYKKLVKDVNHPRFGVHLDICNWINQPYWYVHNRELIKKSFELLAPYTKSIHLKDIMLEPGSVVRFRETMPGTGQFDIAYLLENICQLPVDTPVLLEHLSSFEEYTTALKRVIEIGK